MDGYELSIVGRKLLSGARFVSRDVGFGQITRMIVDQCPEIEQDKLDHVFVAHGVKTQNDSFSSPMDVDAILGLVLLLRTDNRAAVIVGSIACVDSSEVLLCTCNRETVLTLCTFQLHAENTSPSDSAPQLFTTTKA